MITDILQPVGFAIGMWWLATGVALFLATRSERAYGVIMVCATLMLIAATAALVPIGEEATAASAYVGFFCGIMIWGWHELSFLFGYITGPRTTPCPEDARGWQRFNYATQTIIHHEFAILLTGMVLVMLTWHLTNTVGLMTYLILWGMRLSAKFNVFLGVPNMTDEFLPRRLRYLETYFRQAPVTPFFALSVSISTIVTGGLVFQALSAPQGSFAATQYWLLATLMALAVIEHWFLVLRVRDAALWTWLFGSATRDTGGFAAERPDSPPNPSTAPLKRVARPAHAPKLRESLAGDIQ